ncbi:hypothetical protein BDQ12DRAFT_722748 [Crucibulum laeve]|uniref:Uncharacterized protein n=1 Tax=Crucibulum laeve TaxID=68775 RepID=A0A5C3MCL8_9AGAR|nr:hypothetical protein BDQ12DRAFT_722748 [Crucibulum laeve]
MLQGREQRARRRSGKGEEDSEKNESDKEEHRVEDSEGKERKEGREKEGGKEEVMEEVMEEVIEEVMEEEHREEGKATDERRPTRTRRTMGTRRTTTCLSQCWAYPACLPACPSSFEVSSPTAQLSTVSPIDLGGKTTQSTKPITAYMGNLSALAKSARELLQSKALLPQGQGVKIDTAGIAASLEKLATIQETGKKLFHSEVALILCAVALLLKETGGEEVRKEENIETQNMVMSILTSHLNNLKSFTDALKGDIASTIASELQNMDRQQQGASPAGT